MGNNNNLKQQNVHIDASALPTMTCPQCNGYTFSASFVVKKLSAIVSPTGKETIVPIQVFTCVHCGTILPLGNKEMDDIVSDVSPKKVELAN